MKQLVVLSGKGGTGKTTLSGALIKIATNKAFADCDVDAPNLHLIYEQGELLEKKPFYGYQKAVKYDDICINCGKCEELCKFGAIKQGVLNPYDCEGCGVCEAFCPALDEENRPAIRLEDNISGETTLSKIKGEIFSTAQLVMGNGASGKLVMEVRKNLYKSIKKEDLVIIDGSPGIGCPVIASVTGVDLVLIVAEPTLSGLHDMKRIIETAQKLHTRCVVCINKHDLNLENSALIETYCKEKGIQVVGRIPFDPLVVKAVNRSKTIMDVPESSARKAIMAIWDNLAFLFQKEER